MLPDDPVVLFEYKLEENSGSIVLSIRGAVAEASLKQLRRDLDQESISIASLLSGLVPIKQLARRSSSGFSPGSIGGASPSAALNEPPAAAEDFLNQELDQTFAEFQEQVKSFRAALEETKRGRETQGVTGDTVTHEGEAG